MAPRVAHDPEGGVSAINVVGKDNSLRQLACTQDTPACVLGVSSPNQFTRCLQSFSNIPRSCSKDEEEDDRSS